jgi:hypothetical protein
MLGQQLQTGWFVSRWRMNSQYCTWRWIIDWTVRVYFFVEPSEKCQLIKNEKFLDLQLLKLSGAASLWTMVWETKD